MESVDTEIRLQNDSLNDFERMKYRHLCRVKEIANGDSPMEKKDGGLLVVHAFANNCDHGRASFSGLELKQHGSALNCIGDRGGYSRFNVDGYLKSDSRRPVCSYSHLFHDGHLESVMHGISFVPNQGRAREDSNRAVEILRDQRCEKAMLSHVPTYLDFCEVAGLDLPVWVFASLVGCKGFRIAPAYKWGDYGEHAIDRSPATLHELLIGSRDECADKLRGWCDSLWQSAGYERSTNFDEEGNWVERSRY